MNFYKLNQMISEKFDKDGVEKANSSYRKWIQTSVSKRVEHIIKTAKKPLKILDYGSGTDAIHTQNFKNTYSNKNSKDYNKNYKFYAYDFGDNFNPLVHDNNIHKRKYDLIFASNVLNVQTDKKMLGTTLKEIKSLLKNNGIFIANYPKAPRYLGITNEEFVEVIKKYFSDMKIDDSYKQGILFSCKLHKDKKS